MSCAGMKLSRRTWVGAVLEVQGVVAGYGGNEVLHGISLKVDEGECVAILGANGAGKSTLLQCITGLHRLQGGTVHFAGEDVTRSRSDELVARGMVLVPEGRHVFPDLSVSDNLLLGAHTKRARAGRRERMGWVYELLPRLAERRGQAAGTLSGGEQQMLAIGRGLMAKPSMLCLDEPSLGLAPVVTEFIFDAIRRLTNELSVVLVEQDTEQSLEICDRGYVMESGAWVFEGSAKELAGDERLRTAYLGI